MTYHKLIILSLCLLLQTETNAQIIDTGHKVDTLSIADRISVRTNGSDWLCLTPNIGIEYDLKRYNWSRWALTLDVRGNWNTNPPFKTKIVYDISGARLGLKYYYRFRKTGDPLKYHSGYTPSEDSRKKRSKNKTSALFRGKYPQMQDGFVDRLLTCRSDSPRHPEIAFYRGVYVSYNNFSIKLSNEGKRGSAITAGLTWGFVKPLYGFANGNTLDFEAGISAGMTYAKYTPYTLDETKNIYVDGPLNNWALRLIPVISDIRLGFVYRIGKYPSAKKYRWRYDCDYEYQIRYEDELNRLRNQLTEQARAKEERSLIHNDFMRVLNEEIVKTDTGSNKYKNEPKKRKRQRNAGTDDENKEGE